MTKLDDLRKAAADLSPQELAKFRSWLDKLDAAPPEAPVGQETQPGPLKGIAKQAIAGFKAGRTRNL